MLAWKRRLMLLSYCIGDIISVIFSMLICYFFMQSGYTQFLGMSSKLETLGFIILTSLIIMISSWIVGLYELLLEENEELIVSKIRKSFIVLIVGYMATKGMLHWFGIKVASMDLIIFMWTFMFISIFIREIHAFIFGRGHYRSEGMSNVLILGYSERGAKYIDTIMQNRYSYINIVGFMRVAPGGNCETLKDDPVVYHLSPDERLLMHGIVSEKLHFFDSGVDFEMSKRIDIKAQYAKINDMGEISQLADLLQNTFIDEIVVAESLGETNGLEKFLEECQTMGITITMLLKKKNRNDAKTQVAMFGDVPALKFHTVSLNENQLMMKRLVDVMGSMIGMLLFGIAYIIIAPLIKLESPGPVIFKQQRVGKNGRIFEIWKFRSMCNDAENQKEGLMSKNEMKGNMFKMSDDPRVTKIGNFIRKTSIDELPQFYNVFVGDMSLVGTRPPTIQEVENYQLHQRKRISIIPGITGIWQISGRSDITDFEEVVKMDNEYIENWSVLLDIKILFKTVGAVLKKKGSK